MRDFKKYYQDRVVDAETALKKIKDNSRVIFSHATGEPSGLIDVMVANKEWFHNVEIMHMVAMGKSEYCQPGMEPHFRHNSFFVGASTRQAVYEGRADFTPCFLFEIPSVIRSEEFHVDVAMVQVCPPDEFGNVSLGVTGDYTVAAVEQADIVIAQVNKYVPRTFGDVYMPVENFDYFVEMDQPLINLPQGKISDVEIEIGKYCGSLIKDGDTLQLGIGSLPDAVLMTLNDKNDLGVHSEMLADGVVDLCIKGNINNSVKTINKGKTVVSFLMGTEKLYNYVNNNPTVEVMAIDYVNNPFVVAQNDNMISINSCVQVDMMGQVCSESIGLKQISAVGGQVDFVRGANASKGGKSIIAMPSTAAGGKVSKIVPFLDHGATVTTSRADVGYIITEYGIAYLRGQTLRERARRLINIAHPTFRDGLKEEYERRFHESFKD